MDINDTTDTFLAELKKDFPKYKNLETSQYSLTQKKHAIRSLMNIRMPKTVSGELLDLQDAYLQEDLAQKGIVSLSTIPTIKEQLASKSPFSDKISLWQGDITKIQAGAIVNAANSQLLGCFIPCHKCIDNAIHSAAGMQLRAECNHIMNKRRSRYGRKYEEPTGTATLTNAYNLPCDYVIHTVGPIVYDRLNASHCKELQNCYKNVLKCCVENKINSVAFCCISTGEFHFPNEKAAEIAWNTVATFLEAQGSCIERIIFNVFTDNDRKIYEKILGTNRMEQT